MQLDAKLKSTACRRAGDLLAESFEAGAALAASCASTFLLAEAGLLDGRRATTTWWLAPLFRHRYPRVELVTDRMVVADWPIATGGAAMAQMDLMLAVVGRFAGPGLARTCANYLLLEERRSQAPFMAITFLARQDPKIAKAEKWVRDNIGRDFAIEELAEAVALAPRTFARRIAATCGVSPIQFVQRIRIETARYLLETTRLSVEEIARQGGLCGALHPAPADPARHQAFARTFPPRRLNAVDAGDDPTNRCKATVYAVSGPDFPNVAISANQHTDVKWYGQPPG